MVNALGICAEEGRARLRNASVSCHEALLTGGILMGEPNCYMQLSFSKINLFTSYIAIVKGT